MRLATILLAAALAMAACGVEGPPEPPEPRTGVTFGGELRLGVAGDI
jgi:hypothetical protein